MSRTRAVLTAAVLLSALALGGCTDDDPEPKFGPTESTSPASPTSPSTTGAAAGLSPEDTVRAWVDAQNEALRTGDTSALTALSHDPCKSCDQFVEPIVRVYSAGGYFHGGTWNVAAAKARPIKDTHVVVDAGVEIAGGTTRESSDADPVVYEAEKHIMQFRLVSAGEGWAVSFIGFVS